MTLTRVIVLVLALAAVAGCSGGGGSTPTTPGPAWEKFRHDLSNSGQGSGVVVKNPDGIPTSVDILWSTSIDPAPSAPTDPTPSAISASPAIGLNGTIFIGSEGGTLAAINPDGSTMWKTDSCSACLPRTAQLGALMSSPAVYTNGAHTSVFVGSMNGSLYAFEFDGSNFPVCTVCFQPTDLPTGAVAAFVSSPTFTINGATANVAGIFVGAKITDQSGELYALNTDGSLKWQYPRTGATPIGAITSSPAFGLGSTLYFTTDDGVLYALTPDGGFKWTAEFPSGVDVALAPSALVNASSVITSSANGVVLALNPDGSSRWRIDVGEGFANCLALGVAAATPTPTPTPTVGLPAPTATGGLAETPVATPTATATSTVAPVLTPVPGLISTAVVAVANSGAIWLFDANTGQVLPVRPTPVPIAVIAACATPQRNVGQLCSSPALSGDGYIVVGSGDGKLHAVSTADGTEPTGWPVPLGPTPSSGVPAPTPQPIRSSPSVGEDGTVYVGSDDGHLYAVGAE
jgi:outer membrane protein assembly factor BamB